MGYRIVYGEHPGNYIPAQKGTGRFLSRLTICILCFLLLVVCFWPAGREVLGDLLLPGDTGVTKQALAHMVEKLRSGEAIGDSISVFCREIIDGAKLSD